MREWKRADEGRRRWLSSGYCPGKARKREKTKLMKQVTEFQVL